ncbi:LytR family transcriptional regulator [Actinomadura logoneensis]|uniref:LytR family transcriptional regulator n=1 Tax=Actinomadura logoneensis TaxID=2293572 RepID=A0A372JL63_9ACTN|nr:LCP family protein [Actinomadura logoneensis]RFU40556.1 LytR family transcriptional regulator [Actinomadura logoneensis]
MTDGHGSTRGGGRGDDDPLERYFRPRPGGVPTGSPAAEDGEIDGVTVDGVPAPRVTVDTPRGPRRPDRGTPPALGPRAVMSARRQRRFLAVTGTMSAFVLLTSGAAWAFQNYVTGTIDKVSVGGLGGGKDAPKGAMTILVAGVDRREGLTREQQRRAKLGHEPGERSDTMLLVHVNRDHDKVSVVSLPRDSYVQIPAHKSNGSEGAKGAEVPARYGKLTWAYQFGGPDLTVATIKQATGVPIDHYVEVNFYGFVNMVDSLGGVDVCTEQAVNDPKSGLALPAGKSHVDGLKALAYSRARYTLGDGTDLGRIDRQQAFIASLMKQALSSRTLSDPVKSTKFLNAALHSLRVDRKLADDLPKLADQMKGVSTDHVTFAKVPLSNPGYNVVLWNQAQPQSTVQWDKSAADDLFTRIRRDQPLTEPPAKPSPTTPAASPTADPDAPTVAPKDIDVRVLNAVGTPRLAARAGGDLREVGFQVTVVPGIAERGRSTTLIQYGASRADSAKTLAAAIPGAKLKQVDGLGSRIQVLVGDDWTGAKKVHITPTTSPSATASPSDPNTHVEAKTASDKLCK